jgi:hypothetical protein
MQKKRRRKSHAWAPLIQFKIKRTVKKKYEYLPDSLLTIPIKPNYNLVYQFLLINKKNPSDLFQEKGSSPLHNDKVGFPQRVRTNFIS